MASGKGSPPPWGVTTAEGGKQRPDWRRFERDGAYILPSSVEVEAAQFAAHARMQQLALACEEGDPSVARFHGINEKVAQWDAAYLQSLQAMNAQPLRKSLSPVRRQQQQQQQQEELDMHKATEVLTGQPSSMILGYSQVDGRFEERPALAPLSTHDTPRALYVSKAPRPVFQTGSPRLAPLEREAAAALAASGEAVAPALAFSATGGGAVHWTDMVRSTPDVKAITAFGRESVEAIGERVWAPQQKSFLPLTHFSDSTLAEKAISSATARGKGALARSKWVHNNGDVEWRECKVVAASADEQQYLIEWRVSGKQKWVSVLNILFEGDSEDDLVARRAAAEGNRATSETAMLRKMLVRRMPRGGDAEMPTWLRDNIRRRIGRLAEGPKLSKFSTPEHPLRLGIGWMQSGKYWLRQLELPDEEKVGRLFAEVTDDFLATNNEVVFDHAVVETAEALPEARGVKVLHELQTVQGGEWKSQADRHVAEECQQAPAVAHTVGQLEGVTVVGNRFRLSALQAIHMYVQDITELDLFGVKSIYEEGWPVSPSGRRMSRGGRRWSPPGRGAPLPRPKEDTLMMRFLEDSENTMMATLREISSRVLSNICNIVMDAAEEEAVALGTAGRSPAHMDVDAYSRLVVLANMKVHNVLKLHLSQSIQVYTDAVGLLAAKEVATSLFFTNLEEADGKIVYNPSLNSFTERLIATIASAVDAMNKTPAVAMTPALVWNPAKGTPPFTIELAGTLPPVLHMDSPLTVAATSKIGAAMARSLVNLRELLNTFADHDRLLGAGAGAGELFVKQWKQHNGDRLEDWEDAIAAYRKEEAEMVAELPTQISIGIYHVNCAVVRDRLVSAAQWFAEILLSELAREALALASGCKTILSAILADITAPSHNLEELYALLDRLATYPAAVDEQRGILEKVGARLQLLDKYHFQLPPDDFVDIWATMALPKVIDEATATRRDSILAEEAQYIEHLRGMQDAFSTKLHGLKEEVDRWATEDDEDEASYYVVEVRRLSERLGALRDEARLINSREALIKWEPTDYKQIEDLNKQLAPYVELWTLVSEYQKWMAKWMYGPLFSFSLEKLEKQVPLWMKTTLRLEKALSAGPYRVAVNTKTAIEECSYYLPLMTALRTPGLRERHWLRIHEITGVDPDGDRRRWSMEIVIQLGFMDHLLEIGEVVDLAIKEMVIEKALDKVDAEFSTMEIDLRPHGRTGTLVMAGGEALVLALDDTLLRLQALLMNPYVGPHKDRAVYWEAVVKGIQSLVTLWLDVQRSWAHAEVLFNSETTAKQMPTEARRFAVIDIMWRNIVAETRQFPNLIDISQRTSLIERLKDAQQRLAQIIKGMHEYLNLKRMQFPRFNFLSNDTLLELLERSREPSQVQPYLHKVFPGAEFMVLAPTDDAYPDACTLLGISSADGERLLFDTPIQLRAQATGAVYEVDQWMAALERGMREAILRDLEAAARSYGVGNYRDWLFATCSQAVTAVSSMVWSHEVSTILNFIQESCEGNESERQRVTEAGTRGSFIPDAHLHGRGSQHVSRNLRHAEVVATGAPPQLILDDIEENEEEGEGRLSSRGTGMSSSERSQSKGKLATPRDGEPADDSSATTSDSPQRAPRSIVSMRSFGMEERIGMPKRFQLPIPSEFLTKRDNSALSGNQAGEVFSVLQGRMSAELHETMRLMGGSLKAKHRRTLANLVITKIYQRDMVERLILEKVEHEGDFEWVRQLRYEFRQEDAAMKETKAMMVRCMETRLEYGLEYLGAHQRLVLTPLTERAFATLLSAVHLNKGGAPEGPAGTGKTETVKELARYGGKQFVLYNCTESLDVSAIVKILAGAVSTGAWACFDEFNRLQQGVLSVLAKHILAIQTELVSGSGRVQLGPHQLVELNPSMALYITSNPNYVGRMREMPSNIKELFRPVAMMAPDYAIIAEVLLLAAGFKRARQASQQIVGCLQVAGQRLSRTAHYDFGMRTLRLLIQKCEALKAAASADAAEDYASPLRLHSPSNTGALEMMHCHSALKRVVIPRLLPQDVPLFETLLQNAFPEDGGSRGDNLKLVETLRKVGAETPGVVVGSHIIRHAIQLADMVEMQPGVMLLGSAGCGKTILRSVLADTLRRLNAKSGWELQETVINPKATDLKGLFGSYAPASQTWNDGVFTAALRDAWRVSTSWHWIVLDGPVDPIWMEDLNTLLDDSRELSLASGEAIKLRHGSTLLFETDSIAQASPASIGRVGIVHMLHDPDDWRHAITCWVNSSLPAELVPHANKFDVMIKAFCKPLLAFLAMPGRALLPQTPVALVRCMLRLLSGQLAEQRTSTWVTLSIRDTNVMIESFVMFAIVWSIGANCSPADRGEFNEEMRRLQHMQLSYQQSSAGIIVHAHMRGVLVPFPADGSVYDYLFNPSALAWDSWAERAYAGKLPHIADGGDVRVAMVPTAESVARMRILELLFLPGDGGAIMLAGPTGSGKSLLVEAFLNAHHRWMGDARATSTSSALPDKEKAAGAAKLAVMAAGTPGRAREREQRDRERAGDKLTALFHVTVPLSGDSSAEEVQASVRERLQKVTKGVLGPPGRLPGVVFIDDMGLAGRDVWGASAALEAVRSWVEQRAWREPGTVGAVKLERLQFFCAYTTGLLGSVDPRFMCQCAVVTTPAMNSAALARVFKAICDVNLVGCGSSVRTEAHALVEASCTVLREVSSRLLPVPSRPHYLFTVRDLARVFQGIITASKASITTPERFAMLWYHETMRSMFDKLLDLSLRRWFMGMLAKVMEDYSCISRKQSGDPDGMQVLYANFFRYRGDVYDTALYEPDLPTYLRERVTRTKESTAGAGQAIAAGQGLRMEVPHGDVAGDAQQASSAVDGATVASSASAAAAGGRESVVVESDNKEAENAVDEALKTIEEEDQKRREDVEKHGERAAEGLASLRRQQRELGRQLLETGGEGNEKASLRRLLELYQDEFNLMNPRQPLHMVMFRATVAQLARIARIVAQPGGHLLLLGHAGSGRNGIARLGIFLSGLQIVEINVKQDYSRAAWREDLKKMLQAPGVSGRDTALLLRDRKRYTTAMFDDLVQLMISGNVRGMYTADEVETVAASLRKKYLSLHPIDARTAQPTNLEIMQFYFDRCRQHLRVVLTTDPQTALFSDRLRQFPQLVSLCHVTTIDQWSSASRTSVAQLALGRVDLLGSEGVYAGKFDATVQACVEMHRSMQALTHGELDRDGLTQVGNAEFLELLRQVPTMMKHMQLNSGDQHDKYIEGVNNMKDLAQKIRQLEEALISIQPAILASSDETERLLQRVHVEQDEASMMQQQLEVEEKAAEKSATEAQTLRDQCDADLEASMPPLRRALKELQNINKGDIAELKSLKNPPVSVKVVMKAVCHMLGCIPQGVLDRRTMEPEVEDALWWRESMKLLGQINFMEILLTFDKNSIPQSVIDQVDYFTSQPEFNAKAIAKVSKAATCLCRWVLAIDMYHDTKTVIGPKTEALNRAERKLQEKRSRLEKKRETLASIQSNLEDLRFKYESAMAHRDQLQVDMRNATEKVERARHVLRALTKERAQWEVAARELNQNVIEALGNALLAAAFVAYAGPLSPTLRTVALEEWKSILSELKLEHNPNFDFASMLSDELMLAEWIDAGLSQSSTAIETAIIMERSSRWPLIIDPQEQAISWLQQLYAHKAMEQVSAKDPDSISTLIRAVERGVAVIITSDDTGVSPVVDQLYERRTFRNAAGESCIQIGEAVYPCSERFKPFLWTRLARPEFSQALLAKTQIINFTITADQLVERVFLMVLRFDNPEMDRERAELRRTKGRYQAALREIEQGILEGIASKDAVAILESPMVYTMLSQAQTASADLKAKLERVNYMQQRIMDMREVYVKGVATMASVLYFMLSDLSTVNHAYRFSLKWFSEIFNLALAQCPRSSTASERMVSLRRVFTELLYNRTCQSLYEKDKLPLALTMTLRLMQSRKEATATEVAMLVHGHLKVNSRGEDESGEEDAERESRAQEIRKRSRTTRMLQIMADQRAEASGRRGSDEGSYGSESGEEWGSDEEEAPLQETQPAAKVSDSAARLRLAAEKFTKPPFISEGQWAKLVDLTTLAPFSELLKEITENVFHWKEFLDSDRDFSDDPPQPWISQLSQLHQLLLTRVLQPQRLMAGIQRLVAVHLGPDCANTPAFDIDSAYEASSCTTPLIYVLTPGAHPVPMLMKFADQRRRRVLHVMMGHDQGDVAEKTIRSYMQQGRWVLLENLHLAGAWIQKLVTIVNQLDIMQPHPEFRLWMTMQVNEEVPASLLQASLKLIDTRRASFTVNLQRAVQRLPQDVIADPELGEKRVSTAPTLHGTDDAVWRRLVMAVCYFHAMVLERRHYGHLSWNLPYNFSDTDFDTSIEYLFQVYNAQVKHAARKEQGASGAHNISDPLAAVSFFVGQCVYGGRVTDSWDRRVLQVMLDQLLLRACEPFGQLEYVPGGPVVEADILLHNYAQTVENMGEIPDAAYAVGLHPVASLAQEVHDHQLLVSSLKEMDIRKFSTEGPSQEDVARNQAEALLRKIPLDVSVKAGNSGKMRWAQLRQLFRRNSNVRRAMRSDSMGSIPDPETSPVMDLVLQTEKQMYQELIGRVRANLTTTVAAIDGMEPMTEEVQACIHCLYYNHVPLAWRGMARGIDSSSLSAWAADLDRRLIFMRQWIRDGAPITMPLGLLLAPNVFLASLLQWHAQEYGIPIGRLSFDCQVLAREKPHEQSMEAGAGSNKPIPMTLIPETSGGEQWKRQSVKRRPAPRSSAAAEGSGRGFTLDDSDILVTKDGLILPQAPPPAGWFVAGLVLQGAAWNNAGHCLEEVNGSQPEQLMPIVWLVPTSRVRHGRCLVRETDEHFDTGRYLCPLYYGDQESNRGPESVRSDNDMSIAILPLQGGPRPEHWVQRGVALRATTQGIQVLPKSQQSRNAVDDIITINLDKCLEAARQRSQTLQRFTSVVVERRR